MNNYVRWHRINGQLEVQVAENLDNFPNKFDWKSYTSSDKYLPDTLEKGFSLDFISKGFRTFQNCVKHNYKVIDINGNTVE